MPVLRLFGPLPIDARFRILIEPYFALSAEPLELVSLDSQSFVLHGDGTPPRTFTGHLLPSLHAAIAHWVTTVEEEQRAVRRGKLRAIASVVRVERQGAEHVVVLRRDGDDPSPFEVGLPRLAARSTIAALTRADALREKLLMMFAPDADPVDVRAVLDELCGDEVLYARTRTLT